MDSDADINTTGSSKQALIVETAYRLFKQNGFYATGVDIIMQEAGISKRTLYKYFRTKNELIAAVLAYYRASYQVHMATVIDAENKSARDNIIAIFDDAKNWFGDAQFHGCLAVNAMGEFSGKDPAIEDACMRFKRWEIEVLQGLTRQINADKADELAYKLFVLLEGMSAIAQVTKGEYPVDLTAMAVELIDRYC
ncbi:TetR/AcrR family transcriptional regulator [Methylomonas methanica]|uniref:Transcriptional regulator, TetR family n=1 Tax=Methylomonas methanica (strain DSM 25384 / MC09) TaxID=857087 RepID=G0A1Z1_METMM|nr:TetR/AcrR family transcriptional regulator [Methylomonas methanica]AEG01374.1 transcriptional regulator, TetR family [Methylomonas methanica MC09]